MATTRTAPKPKEKKLQDAVAEKLPVELAGRLPEILTARKGKKVPVFSQTLQKMLTRDNPTAEHCLYSFRTITELHGRDDSYFKDRGLSAGEGREVLRALDRHNLERSLQGVVTLEFATLPPYLSAIWSIKNDLHEVAVSIREILQEEMLHMALVCNMLSAIGCVPKINTAVPTYPGSLPMDVHPDLTVSVSCLSDDALDVFLEIERPVNPGKHVKLDGTAIKPRESSQKKHDKTIGELYDEILVSFQRLNPALSTDRQITGPLSWMVVQNLSDVEKAINIIKRQGEGADDPVDSGFTDLAHYYRFAQIRVGKKLDYISASGLWEFQDDRPIERPEIWPMAVLPAGGYRRGDVTPKVWQLMERFDHTYSHVLDLLQSVWEADDSQAAFWRAIEHMFSLQETALPLMQTPIPNGKGNYGPCFRYIPKNDR